MKLRRPRLTNFSGFAVLYNVDSAPHVHAGRVVVDRIARGAFASSLRPVRLLIDHDSGRVLAERVELEAMHSGVRLRCKLNRLLLPDRIRGLSIQYRNAKWQRQGDVHVLVDGEITHVSIQSVEPPRFPATLARCRLGGLPLTTEGGRLLLASM